MEADINIKITRIGNRYHSRLFLDGKVIDEMACELKCDIGWICREMLRWFDKNGGVSRWAMDARKRQNHHQGRVWYKNQLST
jgi:choline dehydrogenase-like flavoprotein